MTSSAGLHSPHPFVAPAASALSSGSAFPPAILQPRHTAHVPPPPSLTPYTTQMPPYVSPATQLDAPAIPHQGTSRRAAATAARATVVAAAAEEEASSSSGDSGDFVGRKPVRKKKPVRALWHGRKFS